LDGAALLDSPLASRRLLRILVVLIIGAGVVLLILFKTSWPSEILRREVVRRAVTATGGEVTVETLKLRFFPPRLRLEGVQFGRGEKEGEEFRVTCPKADLSLPYRVYLGRFDRVEAAVLTSPVVTWRLAPHVGAGRNPSAVTSLRGAALSFGRVDVAGGSLKIRNIAGGWTLSLEGANLHGAERGISAAMEGRLERGRLSIDQGSNHLVGIVSADFLVRGPQVSAPSFHFEGEADPFHASGALEVDLSGPFPRFHLRTDAALPARETPRPVVGDLSGLVHLEARAESSPGGLRLDGAVRSAGIRYRGTAAIGLTAAVRYRPGDLELKGLEASALGGRLSGDLSLRWEEGAGSEALFEARLKLEGGSAEEVARFLHHPEVPLSGQLDHTGEYRVRGFDLATLEGQGTVGFSGTALGSATGKARGSGRFRIAGASLAVEEASLGTPSTRVRFTGTVPLGRGESGGGSLEVETTHLKDLADSLAHLPGRIQTPLSEVVESSPGANLEYRGQLGIGPEGLSLDGRVKAHALALGESRLGDLEGDFRASSSRIDLRRLVLSGGETTLDASGWFGIEPSARDKGSSLAFRGTVGGGLEATRVEEWFGFSLPVTGRLTASFDLTGRPEAILGHVDWSLEGGEVGSIPFGAASGRLSIDPEGLALEETRLTKEGSTLTASGKIGTSGRPLLVTVSGAGVELDWLRQAGWVPFEVAGRVSFQARVSGTLSEPALEADLESPGSSIAGLEVGSVSAHFTADKRGGSIQLHPAGKGIALSGKMSWAGDLPFEAEASLEDFEVPVSSLGGEFRTADAGLVLSGGAQVRGAVRDRSRLDISGNLTRITLRLGQDRLAAQTPAYFRWRPPRLEVTPVRLDGSGAEITLSGNLEPLAGDYQFTAEGSVSLPFLAPLWPGVVAGGTGAFSLSITGTPEQTRVEGWASLLDARLQGGGLPFPVSELTGRLVLDPPGGFHLEGVTLTAGGGSMALEGKGALRGIRPADLDLAIQGSGVEIRYPPGFRGRYDLDLHLARSDSRGRLTGKVGLVRGVYSKDFKIESRLLSLGGGESLPAEEETPAERASLMGPTELDLDLKAERELWIINDFATLEGRADLHVGGTLADPQVTGRIATLEGGTLRFRRVPYRIERGNIDLIDLDRFNPYFDIAAETRIADYQVSLKLDGSLEHFTYELSSVPPLPQPDIVALLVSGRTLGTLASPAGGGQLAQEVAAGYAAGSLAEGLGGRIRGVTGLDQFSIDPIILTREGDPASRVTLGKQITERLFAAYSSLLGSASQEVYQLEYRVSRDFKFTSIRDADGSIGGDLRYVWRLSTAPGSGAAAVRPTPPGKIERLAVEGDPGIPRWRLLRLFGLRAGDAMDRVRAASGVDRLLALYHERGYLQASVETAEAPVEGKPDRTALTLKVIPGPIVEIRVEGTDSPSRYRKEMVDLWPNSIFPEETPEEARQRLEKILKGEGRYQARVSVAVPVDTVRRRLVVLSAVPGPPVRVESVAIAGNEAIPTSELEKLLLMKPGARTLLKPEEAAADVGRIRSHYLSLGYSEAKVAPPRIDLSDDGTRASLRYQVEEGEPAKVAAVRVEGNHSISTEKLLEGFPVQPNDPFNRAKARRGSEAIRLAYDRAGFQAAKISYDLRRTSAAELVYLVEEGPRRRVGKVEIEGNRMTRREVVEHELTFKEGDPLSREEILRSQRALYRLGAFLSVEIRQMEGEDPEHTTVRIQVAESPNLTQSVGVGYQSEEGVRGLYEVANVNFLGRARTLGLQLRGSGIESRAQVLLKDPHLFNRRLDSLLTSYWERQERESFTLRTRGSSFQVSDKHGEHDRTFYRYTLKDVSLSNLEISETEAGIQSLRLSGLSAAFVHDTREDFFNPHQGIFASFDLGAYGRAIGSEAQFLKFLAVGSLFRKVRKNGVWAQSVRLGLADPFGDSDSLPLSERFFAGGDTTVRGFGRDQVGPKDPLTGKPVGGETLFILNQEMRYPIWRALRGVVFSDLGNVSSRLSGFDPTDLRTVLGLGFRIDTPIGPFRFEYGWKLDREEDESPGEFHISIGQAF